MLARVLCPQLYPVGLSFDTLPLNFLVNRLILGIRRKLRESELEKKNMTLPSCTGEIGYFLSQAGGPVAKMNIMETRILKKAQFY